VGFVIANNAPEAQINGYYRKKRALFENFSLAT
jgi:hypothetical protein